MEENQLETAPRAHVIGQKSWLAYAGVAVLAALLFLGLLPLAFMWNEIAAAAVLAGSALLVGYRVLLVRSVQLYVDDVGVWVHAGVLPWAKGVSGVKWRDIDEANFVPGFWSWLARSYTLRIRHRFTKESEIVLTNIANGKGAVEAINAHHQSLIREGRLE